VTSLPPMGQAVLESPPLAGGILQPQSTVSQAEDCNNTEEGAEEAPNLCCRDSQDSQPCLDRGDTSRQGCI
jgi:hypothetical protein